MVSNFFRYGYISFFKNISLFEILMSCGFLKRGLIIYIIFIVYFIIGCRCEVGKYKSRLVY